VPAATLPEGLNALLNTELGLRPPLPFDFLLADEFIATSLEKVLRRRGVSAEQVLRIEYAPAMRAQEGSKLPHDDWASCVRAPVAGNSKLLVTAAYDRCVRVWSGEACVSLGTSHLDAVKRVAVVPASVQAAAVRASGQRRQRDVPVEGLPAFDLASTSKDGCLKLWNFDGAQLSVVASTEAHIDSVDALAVDEAGRLVCTGSWDKTVKVFAWADVLAAGVTSGHQRGAAVAPLLSFTDHARPVTALAFGAVNGSKTLYSTGLDGCVKVWDVEAGALSTTLPADHAAQCVHARPNEHGAADMIVTGHTDGRLRLHDPRARGVVQVWSGHRQWVYGCSWLWRADDTTPAARPLLATASEDATVRIWDMRSKSGALLTFDKLHNDGVLDVTYAGGCEVASCGKDNRTKTVQVVMPN
jgi:ribosome biogenesis protein YTM1